MALDPDDLLTRALDRAPLESSFWHGQQHWRAVTQTGLMLIEAGVPADIEVIVAFGILHDCRRENEYHDPDHGPRAEQVVRELAAKGRIGLSEQQIELLALACACHNGAGPSADATIGACYDADRLNLPRVGIQPHPDYLSTEAAKDPRFMTRGSEIHDQPMPWSDLFDWAEQMMDKYAQER